MGFVPPDFLPTKGKGILFLDEMNSAPQSVQAAAYGLVLNRRLGEYELPKDWAILAAGNRAGDRGVVNTMPSPLANRLVHIDFDVDVDDWYDWATVAGISDVTRAFIKFRPKLLHSFNAAANERAFPSPRTWHFVDDVTKSSLAPDVEYELIKGTVGEGAAAEYLAFTRLIKDLPTAEEILMNPDGAPIPDAPAAQWAVCTMLDRKTTPNNISAVITYTARMSTEFQVLCLRSAVMANRMLTKTKEFIKWAHENQAVVLS